MIVTEMITEARILFSEQDTTNTHVSDASLLRWANKCYRLVLTALRMLNKIESSLVTALGDIAISARTLTLEKAFIRNPDSGEYQKLDIIDYTVLADIDENWLAAATGDPTHLVRGNTFTVRLYPQPSTKWLAAPIKTYGMVFPTDLATSDTPNVPLNIQDVFENYMAYRAFMSVNNYEAAGAQLKLFNDVIKSQRAVSTGFQGADTSLRWEEHEG